MLSIVKQLIDILKSNEVNYVHFKSNEHLNESVVGTTDFDILVDKNCSQKFEKCLLNLDFKRFVSPERSKYPGVDDWMGFDYDTGSFIHIHTHYQLVTGKAGFKHLVLPWTDIALKYQNIDELTGMPIVVPEYELIELYTRIIVKKNWKRELSAYIKGAKLSKTDLKEAKWLWNRTDPEKVNQMLNLCFDQTGGNIPANLFFKEHLSASEYRLLKDIIKKKIGLNLRSGMNAVRFRSSFYLFYSKYIKKIKKHLFVPAAFLKKTPHSGGILIAFLGVDGSGKTTITDEITKWLSWKFETSQMSLGLGRYKKSYFFQLKQKIKRKIKKNSNVNGPKKIESNGIKSEKKSNFPFKKQHALLKFAKQIRKDILKINSYRLNGGIMVVDRYPQLQFFGIADGKKIDPIYTKMSKKESELLSIVEDIQPDLIFKLIVPVEISKKRRPEDSIEMLKAKYEILEKIEYKKSKIIKVDATQPLQEELLFIKREIWKNL